MSEEPLKYFIRRRGRTLGPFDLPPLERMHRSGRIGSIDEFSTDRRGWRKLTDLEELYPPEQPEPDDEEFSSDDEDALMLDEGVGAAQPPSVPVAGGVEWYYCSYGEQYGPFTEGILHDLIRKGQLKDQDLVWTSAFGDDWRPAIDVFSFPATPPAANQSVVSPVFQNPVSNPPLQQQSSPVALMQSHRGSMILTFGLLGLFVCAPLGIAAWVMGWGDLSQMRSGTMDDSGRSMTTWGTVLGAISTVFFVLMLFFFLAVGGVAIL